MLSTKLTQKDNNLSTQFGENALQPNHLNYIKGGEVSEIITDWDPTEI